MVVQVETVLVVLVLRELIVLPLEIHGMVVLVEVVVEVVLQETVALVLPVVRPAAVAAAVVLEDLLQTREETVALVVVVKCVFGRIAEQVPTWLKSTDQMMSSLKQEMLFLLIMR